MKNYKLPGCPFLRCPPLVLIVLLSSVFCLLFSVSAFAALSISLSGGSWAIGAKGGGVTDTQAGWTITNDGGEPEAVHISVASTGLWTPAATAAPNNFVLKANSASGCEATQVVTGSTTGFIFLPIDGTHNLNLALTTPAGGETGLHTVTVTLTAAAWTMNEIGCNSIPGWHWYTTNGRSACWSKILASSVSWNEGVEFGGNDSNDPGAYTPASGYTLPERMLAAATGEWYKIVSIVDGTTVTSAHNGSAGYSTISALAIADCIDGTRDLCTGSNCLGSDWDTNNSALRTWAGAAGKSALPYLDTPEGTSQGDNDFWDACSQNSGNDLPLECTDGLFYYNRSVCGSGRSYSWVAAVGNSAGTTWGFIARTQGYGSCGSQGSLNTGDNRSFRAVVRP